MSLIKKIITNDFIYDGTEKDFIQDTYTRVYRIKIYFLGLLLQDRVLTENLKRKEKEETKKGKIGF